MQIAVVTRAPHDAHNMAVALDVFQITKDGGVDESGKYQMDEVERLPWPVLLQLRTLVFQVGEILILDSNGRELGYPGRKPDKWGVDIEEVDTLEEAVQVARRVMYPDPKSEED